MDIKTKTTTVLYRIEQKPGGGFIARAEEGPAEILEGATREEVQRMVDDKLAALVGEMLHNDKLTEMVGEMLHNHKEIDGNEVKVNVTSKFSTGFASKPQTAAAGDLVITRSSEPRFETSNKLWMVLALLVAIGAVLMYLLKR